MHLDTAASPVLDLSGSWEYRSDPKHLGEHYSGELAYTHWDDARWMRRETSERWSTTIVPGPWPTDISRSPSPAWFRRRFTAQDLSARWRLEFGGVNYRADVWLNERYLGTHEGYFSPFGFDVSDVLEEDNLLVVRVTPASDVLGEEDQLGQFKHDFVGALGRWDMNDPERKPAGVWSHVRLVAHSDQSVRSAHLRYTFTETEAPADADEAVPVRGSIELELHNHNRATETTILWAVTPVGFDGAAQTGTATTLALPGINRVNVELGLTVRRWWTWDLGEPRLYDVSVQVIVDGQVSHVTQWRTGFRELTIRDGWDLRVNGVTLYQRGANYLSDLDLSSMTPERYRRDVELFRQANLNTVHPFCMVEGPELYAECDRQGLLVYQDIPLWLMVDTSSSMVDRALSTFDDMLALLDAHPSVAIWNFGSQPSVANFEKVCEALVRHARSMDPTRVAHHGNAAISYERHDDVHPTRSFFWPRAEADRFVSMYDWRRDNHMYPGWYFGDAHTITELPREDFTLVTEFGGQSLPDREVLAEFMDPDGPIDWRTIARRCGQPGLLQRHNPDAETVDELIRSSQAHQAALIRHHTEYIRSLKGRPGRGLHVFAFNDCWPSVTWSVVDYYRTPKPAFHALALAMKPVQAFLTASAQPRRPGPQTLDVTIVNDGPRTIDEIALSVEVSSADGTSRTFAPPSLDVPTDRAISHAVEVEIPFGAEDIQITLVLRWENGATENTYVLAPHADAPHPAPSSI